MNNVTGVIGVRVITLVVEKLIIVIGKKNIYILHIISVIKKKNQTCSNI